MEGQINFPKLYIFHVRTNLSMQAQHGAQPTPGGGQGDLREFFFLFTKTVNIIIKYYKGHSVCKGVAPHKVTACCTRTGVIPGSLFKLVKSFLDNHVKVFH